MDERSGATAMAVTARARVEALLREAVQRRVTPGAVVEVGTHKAPIWTLACGALTYAKDSPPTTLDTMYDLASLTKVIATTTLVMRAVTAGAFSLDARLARLISGVAAAHASITVEDLLVHAAGLPAHRPYYLSVAGRSRFAAAIAREPLAYPVGSRSEYSDLGYMLLGWVLEDAFGTPLKEAFARFAREALGEQPIGFGVSRAQRPRVAPTEADAWRGRVLVGEVHDPNAAALGGHAGHAGLFGTSGAVGAFARWLLALWLRDRTASAGVSADVVARFTTRCRVPGSSRALGWDTMLPASSCGAWLSSSSIGHTGFTGTSLWIDPVLDLYVVLLTNRVHPTSGGTSHSVTRLRVDVHDAVARQWSAQR